MTVTTYASPIGLLTIGVENEQIVGLWMENQRYFPDLKDVPPSETAASHLAADWLDRYFAGQQPNPDSLPLAPKGSPFRQEVWGILRRIPYGQTTTYAAIAAELANARGIPRMSAQAVGGAVGRNPIGILIPCHRVLGTDGSLTGYAGGVERKQWLLTFENTNQ